MNTGSILILIHVSISQEPGIAYSNLIYATVTKTRWNATFYIDLTDCIHYFQV